MPENQSPPRTRGIALALAAHPDDIEFYMAGTLLLLERAGYQTHYLNLGSGNCGSLQFNAARTRAIRAREARRAARMLGARYHPSLTDDLEIFYESRLLRRVAAVVREVRPTILLTHSPQDYMEDHMHACRLAVTAAFARGMPNYRTRPSRPAVSGEVTVYHAMPHGLRDDLRRRVVPGAFANTTNVHALKRQALLAHQSQKAWLDASQGMDSYLLAMDEMSLAIGKLSRRFRHAEGWRRHSHLGFCTAAADPLRDALGADYLVNGAYERGLESGCVRSEDAPGREAGAPA
ncbi:MAG: PIG-L family deacetylase [Verrucomicrobia bacterium]|nr:PIG-L family deacetylase [Verrucomicrobiota bacterium]